PEPDWYKGTEVMDLCRALWYTNIADSCAWQLTSASSMIPDVADAVDSGGFFTGGGGSFSGGGFGGGGFPGGGFGPGGGGAWKANEAMLQFRSGQNWSAPILS
ncbi:MAG: hypothetical protein IJH41_04405, partial [Eubacterium sp.]|nr:hypothetical protein [Eubacterium sp.]